MDKYGTYARSLPALTGDAVTQGHADYCDEHGHATHTTAPYQGHEGPANRAPHCPRCGATLPSEQDETIPARYAAELATHEGESGTYRVQLPTGGATHVMTLASLRTMIGFHWQTDPACMVIDARTGLEVDRINDQPTRTTTAPMCGSWVATGDGPRDWGMVRRTPDETGRTYVQLRDERGVRELDMPDGGWRVLSI